MKHMILTELFLSFCFFKLDSYAIYLFMFLFFVFLLSGARNRVQDLPLPQRRSDAVSGGAAEMQVQTGQTGGLRVIRAPSSEGNHGEITRSVPAPTLVRGTLTTTASCAVTTYVSHFFFVAETVMNFLQLLTEKLSDR